MSEQFIINGRTMLTSHEAAHLSGWSQNYIGILCRKGRLPGIRTSTAWLVDADALLAYVARKRSLPRSPETAQPSTEDT